MLPHTMRSKERANIQPKTVVAVRSLRPCPGIIGLTVKRGTVLPYFWMLYGSLSFALMGTLTHALRARCDWQVTAFLRSGLALVFIAVWMAATGIRPVVWRPRILWLRSFAGSMSLI